MAHVQGFPDVRWGRSDTVVARAAQRAGLEARDVGELLALVQALVRPQHERGAQQRLGKQLGQPRLRVLVCCWGGGAALSGTRGGGGSDGGGVTRRERGCAAVEDRPKQ